MRPDHHLTAVGDNYRPDILNATHHWDILYHRDGEHLAAKVVGSHFLYDAERHNERVYVIQDADGFNKWCAISGYSARDLYPIEDLPRLFVQKGQFTCDIQAINTTHGFTQDSFIRIVASDLMDTGHVTFVETTDAPGRRIVHLPTPLYGAQANAVRPLRYYCLAYPSQSERLLLHMLDGTHFLWYDRHLVVVRSDAQLQALAHLWAIPHDELYGYVYPIHDLEGVFREAADGTMLASAVDTPHPALNHLFDSITIAPDPALVFIKEAHL